MIIGFSYPAFNVRTLVNLIKNKEMVFDNIVQRKLVWDIETRSLFIASLIEGYIIPDFIGEKKGEIYDMLDSKQRCDAIVRFVDNKFALAGLPLLEVDNKQKKQDYNGLKFSDLEKRIQDRILDRPLNLVWYEGLTEHQRRELVYRINNGKPFNAVQKRRLRAKSFNEFHTLAKHDMFKSMINKSTLTPAMIVKNEDTVQAAWIINYYPDLGMSNKAITPIVSSEEITPNQYKELNTAFSTLNTVYSNIKSSTEKEVSGAARKIKGKLNLLSCINLAIRANKESISIENLTSFLISFFKISGQSSINEEYNECISKGTAKAETIKKRLEIINNYFTDFIKLSDVCLR